MNRERWKNLEQQGFYSKVITGLYRDCRWRGFWPKGPWPWSSGASSNVASTRSGRGNASQRSALWRNPLWLWEDWKGTAYWPSPTESHWPEWEIQMKRRNDGEEALRVLCVTCSTSDSMCSCRLVYQDFFRDVIPSLKASFLLHSISSGMRFNPLNASLKRCFSTPSCSHQTSYSVVNVEKESIIPKTIAHITPYCIITKTHF